MVVTGWVFLVVSVLLWVLRTALLLRANAGSHISWFSKRVRASGRDMTVQFAAVFSWVVGFQFIVRRAGGLDLIMFWIAVAVAFAGFAGMTIATVVHNRNVADL